MTGILTQSASLVNDLKHSFEVNMKSELIPFTLLMQLHSHIVNDLLVYVILDKKYTVGVWYF